MFGIRLTNKELLAIQLNITFYLFHSIQSNCSKQLNSHQLVNKAKMLNVLNPNKFKFKMNNYVQNYYSEWREECSLTLEKSIW